MPPSSLKPLKSDDGNGWSLYVSSILVSPRYFPTYVDRDSFFIWSLSITVSEHQSKINTKIRNFRRLYISIELN